MQIAEKKVVAIDYKLTDDEGQVLDTSEGREPLQYLHGAGTIIPGLERCLEGKATGDEFQVSLKPDEGYGQRNESLRQAVPRSQFDGIDDLELGMQFRVGTDKGDLVVTVVEIEDETVTVDGNHPLAGVNLNFDVAVRDVRDATEEEISHGHVHGPDGDQH